MRPCPLKSSPGLARPTAGRLMYWLLCLLLATVPARCLAQAAAEGAPAEAAPAIDAIGGSAAAVVARYPARSIDSMASADAALADVARARAEINTRHQAAQAACRPAFFMTRCLDAAKEKRRAALATLRPVEIEANAFKRQERVSARDRALEEKNAKAEREAASEKNSVKIRKPVAPAAPAADASDAASANAAPAKAPPRNPRTPHVAKPLTPSIDAATEARNMAAFDRKAAESAQRQRDIAAKKAEKEQDRARKKAEAAAAAAAGTDTGAAKK